MVIFWLKDFLKIVMLPLGNLASLSEGYLTMFSWNEGSLINGFEFPSLLYRISAMYALFVSVVDPDGVDPDPYPTLEKKKKRIRL